MAFFRLRGGQTPLPARKTTLRLPICKDLQRKKLPCQADAIGR